MYSRQRIDRSVCKTCIEIESKMHLIHRSCQVDCQNSPISNGSDFMIQKGEIKMEHCMCNELMFINRNTGLHWFKMHVTCVMPKFNPLYSFCVVNRLSLIALRDISSECLIYYLIIGKFSKCTEWLVNLFFISM